MGEDPLLKPRSNVLTTDHRVVATARSEVYVGRQTLGPCPSRPTSARQTRVVCPPSAERLKRGSTVERGRATPLRFAFGQDGSTGRLGYRTRGAAAGRRLAPA